MSEIYIPDSNHGIRIVNARVYDLDESIAASKYPMQTEANPRNTDLTPTAVKLAQSRPGEGHDNWLHGVRVAFDITMTAKMMVEAERYHFFDITSSNSLMHRVAKFDMDDAFISYTDDRIVDIVKQLVAAYNHDPSAENYLNLLYSVPSGFQYTLRITTNYRQLKTIYIQRRNHRLPEWRDFCRWIEQLPHSELIIGGANEKHNDQSPG